MSYKALIVLEEAVDLSYDRLLMNESFKEGVYIYLKVLPWILLSRYLQRGRVSKPIREYERCKRAEKKERKMERKKDGKQERRTARKRGKGRKKEH
jgi:hypothetical protein